MKRFMRRLCLLLAVSLALPWLILSPITADDYAPSIIDVKEGDPTWGKPVFAIGDACTEQHIEFMMGVLGINDLDDVSVIIVTDPDVARYVPEIAGGNGSISSVLVQTQPKGSGVEVQIITPDQIVTVTDEQYRMAALTAGLKDVKIVVLSPEPALGTAALAGVYMAYEQSGLEVDIEGAQLGQEQIKIFSGVGQRGINEGAFDKETFNDIVKDIFKKLTRAKEKGKEPNEQNFRDLVQQVFKKHGQEGFLTDDEIDSITGHLKKWWDSVPGPEDEDDEESSPPVEPTFGDEPDIPREEHPATAPPVDNDEPIIIVGEDIGPADLGDISDIFDEPIPEDTPKIYITREWVKMVYQILISLDDNMGFIIYVEPQDPGSGLEIEIVSDTTLVDISEEELTVAITTLGIRDARIRIAVTGETAPQTIIVGIAGGFKRYGTFIKRQKVDVSIRETTVITNVTKIAREAKVSRRDINIKQLESVLVQIKERLARDKRLGKLMTECRVRVTVEDFFYEEIMDYTLREVYIRYFSDYFYRWIQSGVYVSVAEENIIDIDDGDILWDRPILAYGADLTDDQLDRILGIFGIDDPDLVDAIPVTGEDFERILDLEKSPSMNMISSVLVQNQPEGSGVVVQILTPNEISLITETQYQMAALTAGLKDVKIVVATPSAATGESALTGVYLAYELNGGTFNQERLDLAQSELVLYEGIQMAGNMSEGFSIGMFDSAMLSVREQLIALRQETTVTETMIEEIITETIESYAIEEVISEAYIENLTEFYTEWVDIYEAP